MRNQHEPVAQQVPAAIATDHRCGLKIVHPVHRRGDEHVGGSPLLDLPRQAGTPRIGNGHVLAGLRAPVPGNLVERGLQARRRKHQHAFRPNLPGQDQQPGQHKGSSDPDKRTGKHQIRSATLRSQPTYQRGPRAGKHYATARQTSIDPPATTGSDIIRFRSLHGRAVAQPNMSAVMPAYQPTDSS
jgi:hypothetical protein